MAKWIDLTQGKGTVVDNEDYSYLRQFKWSATKKGNSYYVSRNVRVMSGFGGQVQVFMHRAILNALKGQEVDHVDGDGLNNQRYNLRFCTRRGNISNQSGHSNRVSKYKGVYWDKNARKWHAQIKTNGKQKYLGLFVNEIDAAKAYNKAALTAFGEFANINDLRGE